MDNTRKKVHESKQVEGKIAYFKFLKGNPISSYHQGLDEFMTMVTNNPVTALMVVVEDDDAMFSKEMQDIWLNTGVFAEQNDIQKWGVVVPSMAKELTIQYLIEGGEEVRMYDTMIFHNDEDSCLAWCLQSWGYHGELTPNISFFKQQVSNSADIFSYFQFKFHKADYTILYKPGKK